MDSLQTQDYTVSMYDFLRNNFVGNMDGISLSYYGKETSYSELFTNVEQAVKAMIKIGLKPGDRIAVSLVNIPEAIFIIFAANKLGLKLYLPDIRVNEKGLEELCRRIKPVAYFYFDWKNRVFFRVARQFPEIKFYSVTPCEMIPDTARNMRNFGLRLTRDFTVSIPSNVKSYGNFIEDAPDLQTQVPVCDAESKIIYTTSGSSGAMKYVVLDNSRINMTVQQHINIGFFPDESRSVLSVLPAFTCTGWVIPIMLPLVLGKKVYLYPIYRYEKIWNHVKQDKIDSVVATPALYRHAVKNRKMISTEDLSFLKFVFSGGDRINKDMQHTVNCFLHKRHCRIDLIQGYGMTELSSGAILQDKDNYVEGSIGLPLPLTEYRIIDMNTGIDVGPGETGELLIKTPVQMLGYMQEDGEIRDTADADGYIHTGDMCRNDGSGNLFFEGRLSRVAVGSNGTKISLDGIENRVCLLPWVKDCACCFEQAATIDKEGTIVLYIVPDKNYQHNAVKLTREYAKDNFQPFEIPQKIIILGEIPLNKGGKKDYECLREKNI